MHRIRFAGKMTNMRAFIATMFVGFRGSSQHWRPLRWSQSYLWLGVLVWSFLFSSALTVAHGENEWPSWRGPYGNGTNPAAKPPKSWGPETNIAWKVRLPGAGSSTPIVWGNQVIVLAAREDSEDTSTVAEEETTIARNDSKMVLRIGSSANFSPGRVESANDRYLAEQKLTRAKKRYQFSVLSFDVETGNKLWETEVIKQLPHEPCHDTNTFASASPVTDGKHIYAFFGSRGLYCLDMNGKIKWQYFQGRMQTLGSFGEGASPALFEDTLIFPWDHEGDSCLVALNAKNGYVKWKVARQERTNWATPLIVNHNQTKQVIVNGRTVRSYKLETGELLWSCPGQTEQAIPTPLVSQGRVFVTSGLRGWACFAISLDAVGPVPENSEFVHWSLKKQTPYVPSPCNYEGSLFLYNENSRTISVVSEDSGEAVLPPKRLPELGEVYSSLGAANGMVFITDRSGKTLVLDAKSLELLAENTLDETVDASLAFVGDRIFARSSNHLFCLKSE